MSDLDVLTKMPKNSYSEPALECNSDEFEKVVKSRRYIRIYNEEKIPEEIMEKCLDLTVLAPNSSNLQPWAFYWVKNSQKKAEVVNACLGQLAARTAAELIVCVARTDNWKSIQKQMINKLESETPVSKGGVLYYKKIVPLAYNQGVLGMIGLIKKIVIFFQGLKKPIPREPASLADMRVWAHKSCALACENLMLALRAYGYDSCPMEGMDSKRIKRILSLSKGSEICMVISAGKRAENGVFGERIRMPKDQFIFKVD